MHRAYSTLELKSIDEDRRLIAGIASSPEPDRLGDVVEPRGAKFTLPLPLLWQHRASEPIGHVVAANVTDAGIEIQAQIAKGLDIPRIDEVWKLIKAGLVRGLSIGFKAIEEPELIKDTFGLRFSAWEWLELSAVTIPAHQAATILTVKTLDTGRPADVGDAAAVPSALKPAVAGTVRVVKMSDRQDRRMKKTYAEQIQGFEATRQAKTARMDEIMSKAADEGRTLEQAETDEYDALVADVTQTDEHLVRLRAAEERNKMAAVPAAGTTQQAASQSRAGQNQVITVKPNQPPGIGLARAVMCKMASYLAVKEGNFTSALDFARQHFPDDVRVHQYLVSKTAVLGGTSQHATWAGPLVYADNLSSEFIEFLRPQTIVGKFGTGGIPSLRRVPFNVRIPRQTTGATGYWVGEGLGKPLSAWAFDAVTLTYTKVAAMAVITQELARFSAPAAEGLVRDELAKAVIERLDRDFIDPSISASSFVRPASITNGVTALTTAGTSADNVRTDIQNILEQYILNNLSPSSLVLIMPNTLSMVLGIMVNSLGNPEFPNIGINGGTLLGVPVIASQYAASGASFGNMVIAVKADDVALADDGNVSIDISGEASLQMDDAPTQSSATPTATSVVSMFQTNSLAVRAEREIHWAKLRSTAVVYMDDVNWGSIGSPF